MSPNARLKRSYLSSALADTLMAFLTGLGWFLLFIMLPDGWRYLAAVFGLAALLLPLSSAWSSFKNFMEADGDD